MAAAAAVASVMSDFVRPHRRQPTRSGLPFPSPMHESESEVAHLCPTLVTPWTAAYQGAILISILQMRTWFQISVRAEGNYLEALS